MFTLLRQPYPIEEAPRTAWLRAALIGLFVGLFLLTFQPFGTDRWQTPHKALKLLGFGAVSFVVTAVHFILWPRLFPRAFSDERWTVGKAIAFITVNVLLIALFNWLYLAWLTDGIIGAPDVARLIGSTFLVGIFPTTGAVLASYVIQLRRYVRQAANLTVAPARVEQTGSAASPASTTPTDPTFVRLTSENEKDVLTFPASDLLFIESADNYCTVHYLSQGQPTKFLLRSSLSRMAGQINVPHSVRQPLVRCHRSYIVNLDRVERVTGNAQGYKLHLLGGTYLIPVARQYNDTLVAELKGL